MGTEGEGLRVFSCQYRQGGRRGWQPLEPLGLYIRQEACEVLPPRPYKWRKQPTCKQTNKELIKSQHIFQVQAQDRRSSHPEANKWLRLWNIHRNICRNVS